MKEQFLDLGQHPIANGFLTKEEFNTEFFYNLSVGFDEETKLVSLMEFVEPSLMFNDNYIYNSAHSIPLREHFYKIAVSLENQYRPNRVLEIGSNSGPFLKNFNAKNTFAVEPCGNFAKITNNMGYKTYPKFWNNETAREIQDNHGKMDLIYAANCFCHIQDLDEAFSAVERILSPDGIFVFEDPSLLKMIARNSYDQIYDEHAHIFSVTALNNILSKFRLKLFKVEKLDIHGGSNRIYVRHDLSINKTHQSVTNALDTELSAGLNTIDAYEKFAERVELSKEYLKRLLVSIKDRGEKIVSYGATSKSTTVFNYCKIGPDIIDYIVDTTPEKQGKFSPGMHIPVVSPEHFSDSDVCFLSAWNFADYIMEKEKDWTGRWITHIPYVKMI